MATFTLVLALFALFSSLKTETKGQMINVTVESHTTVDLQCSCPICPDSTTAVQWYRSSNSDVFKQDGRALAWWYEGETGSSQGFGIKDDFSILWYSVNLGSKGLYRCIVTPFDGAECTHDAKLIVYANPDSAPVIEYIRETNGFIVTCSISNIFPITFPRFTTKGRDGTVYINKDKQNKTLNIDGTYNTKLTHWFSANEKDTIIECLYSYLNFKTKSSLRIVDNDITVLPEEGDRKQNNMTDTNICNAPSGLWMVWVILVIEVLFVFVIVYAIKTGRVLFNPTMSQTIPNNTTDLDRHEHNVEIEREQELAKSRRNVLFGVRCCTVITVIIPITVSIMIVAYLANARLLKQTGN